MPYKRIGKAVFKKVGKNHWVLKGKSKSAAMAKRYLRALYAHSKEKPW